MLGLKESKTKQDICSVMTLANQAVNSSSSSYLVK